MKKENLIFILIALIVGLLGGYLIFSVSSKKPAESGGGIPLGGGSPADYQKRISEAEKIVVQDPKNRPVWISLGNDYFDTGQSQKAIYSYGKALELKPDDPNVLTDQGVMFKQVGAFDKALANFERAQQIDPNHLQSLYNIGVVCSEDLFKPDKAIKAWSRYLEIDSTSPTAQKIKGMLEQLKASPKSFK